MGWNRYLICIFIFPREGNAVRLFTVTSNGIFYYFSCFGEANSTINLLSMFSSSTKIVSISLVFCICSLSPSSRFPSCKALRPSLRVSVSQSLLFPWHFSPIPFPAWQGSVLQMPLEDSRDDFSLLYKAKKSTQAQTQIFPPWLLSTVGTFWGAQSMLCCYFPGETDFGSRQFLFTLCAEAAPCLSLLVWWFYFCIIFPSFFL